MVTGECPLILAIFMDAFLQDRIKKIKNIDPMIKFALDEKQRGEVRDGVPPYAYLAVVPCFNVLQFLEQFAIAASFQSLYEGFAICRLFTEIAG